MSITKFHESVFINCPFDKEYKPIFNAIVFTVIFCGFKPRSAREKDNSDDIRIEKIISIIKSCKFGIHDICRTELDKINKLPRFNMPLELGLDLGIKKSGLKELINKQILILDKEDFRYQKFISDIAGQDIKSHKSTEEKVIICIREFLGEHSSKKIAHGSKICNNYKNFKTKLPLLCKENLWTVEELSFNEYVSLATAWISISQTVS